MDEKNKLSEEVRKQFNELLRNKKFNEAINLIEPFANSGCLDAAYCLCFMLTGLSKHPDGVAAHIHLVLDKLLHADWFLSLLDYETEREKKEGYTGKNAIKLLNDLAEKGNRDALNKLTEIGMQLGGLVAGWAGGIHYALQEYDIALRCYRLGKDKHGLARMYERGEGVSLDAEKAFHYYVEAESYYNMGRMYEQGIGTKKDLQKAFECYHKIIHEECWNHASDDKKMRYG